MLDKDDIMVKDIKEILDNIPDNDSLSQAINIMYQIRGHKDKYFRIMDVEHGK